MTGRPGRARAAGRAAADTDAARLGGEVPVGGVCGARKVRRIGPDGVPVDQGECKMPAGYGTPHLGVGRCHAHAGNSTRELARGAWLMGHALARELNVTPWEALLTEVRRSAGEVAWLDAKVGSATSDADLEPNGPLYFWAQRWKEQRQHLARVSKMALDAGVAERMVAQMQLEGDGIARAVIETLTELGIADDDLVLRARGIISRKLLALETQVNALAGRESEGTIDGDWTE